MVKFFEITVEGGPAFDSIDSVERYLAEENIERFFENRIEGYIRDRARQRFATEGDDASGPWTPLSRATVKVKTSGHTFSHGINFRTGQLMQWATEGTFDTSRGASSQLFTYPKKKPEGKLLKKVKGAQQGDGAAPARPVVALGEVDAIAVMERFGTYFDEVLR